MGKKTDIDYRYITPKVAKCLLATSRQKKVYDKRVNDISKAMREGKWKAGEETVPIILRVKEGKEILSNGNHRLRAVIDSGISNWFKVEIRE